MKHIPNKNIENQISKGKRYILVIKKTGPNRDQSEKEAEEIQEDHQKYLFTLKEKGILLINGPVLDDPGIKGIGIYNSADKKEVMELALQDPAVKAGRLVAEVYEWFSIPGATLV